MQGSKNLAKRLTGILLALLCLLSVSTLAWGDIILKSTRVQQNDEGYQLNAHFSCSLTPSLEDALRQGVSLGFVIDLEINKARRFWFDTNLVSMQRRYKLNYYALTRQYRLYYGGLVQNFSRLDSALGVMCSPSAWQVLDKSREEPGLTARIRMQLDTDQLPKPFQINAITSKDWTLDSDWYSFNFATDAAP
ncbi:DUF4390 domain-containing protein [Leeia oryzae]|uniref:DUF4390 domain-containing protein n=1 Tax=Leeia oryzae TaxID=356662 RepID=UPI0003803264|nr:DUF4390 domain-containing protein [Leeia oryzae]